MRRQHFLWTYLVLAIVATLYGSFSLFSSAISHKEPPLLGIVFLVVGASMFVLLLIAFLVGAFKKKRTPVAVKEVKEDETSTASSEALEATKEPQVDDEPQIGDVPKGEPSQEIRQIASREVVVDDEERPVYRRSYASDEGSAYVRQVGHGPVLRVEGADILDMRSNTYYRIEGNTVKRAGAGLVYEISGNRIKSAFGSCLYEISGSSVNKVFGGYYASFDGNGLKTSDLRVCYEISGSLSLQQKLAIVALLFGPY